ncbi:bestrophin-3-like [Paramacrobiotus metropolitanus]|uniref:bestrophin-3-like n=1 Tax=Paramacrobiotus metropolitanus TaxID=2943436 RepID=UPI0024462497|nr:bestrophin-3-like [Paramacrobiotus metropolitanus]
MTISYQFNVATASFAGFPRLLCRWKGSVYKLVFKEVLVFVSLYAAISAIYRCALDEERKRMFEKLCLHMQVSVDFIPLTFVLGFYVSFVVGRWWDQFSSYPWPDRLCYLIILYINGSDEKSRMIRRTLVRYLNASTVLLTRSVSIVAKKRFPTFQHLVEAGLLTPDEFKAFEGVEVQYAKFWVPLVWFTQLVDKTRKDGLFNDPSGGMKQVMDELMAYRDRQGKIWAFDYVSIPIVYTQVVTLATYMYFVGCLFSRQFLEPSLNYENYYVDIYVPVFTLLQFFFYVGWLKVAESLINPWGEDDDDFEVNWFIDRHMQVSYAMVDDMYDKLPPMEKDKYWNERDVVLPYTLAAMETKKKLDFSHLGSTMNLNLCCDWLPGCPVVPADGKKEERFRKISSPARMKFFQPDRETMAKFNQRLRTISDNSNLEEMEAEKPTEDVTAMDRPNSAQKTDSSEPLLSPDSAARLA